MPIPAKQFSELEYGQIYDAFRGELRAGAIAQAKTRVISTFSNGFRGEFTRCQARVLGPYALEFKRDGQPATYEYHIGCGELLTIEAPPFPGTITVFNNTSAPS
jgi:hypothetical protein